jgi:hypothetical protein
LFYLFIPPSLPSFSTSHTIKQCSYSDPKQMSSTKFCQGNGLHIVFLFNALSAEAFVFNSDAAIFPTGPLMQPRGQTSVLYSVPDAPTPEQVAEAQAQYSGMAEQEEVTSQPEQLQPEQQQQQQQQQQQR